MRLVIPLSLLVIEMTASGQTISGSISGTIVDSSGAAVSGAK
jgi:hypothetical protein